jgi:maleate isomerase
MHRVGLIIPSSNVVVEDTLRRENAQIDEKTAFHIARFSVVEVNLGLESTDQFQDRSIDRAIDQLREADVNRIVFAGTAGAWLGIDRERAWCADAKNRAQVDVTSTTLLTLDALRASASTPIGLVTPFTPEVHDQIVKNFNAEGVKIDCGCFLGLELSREMAQVQPDIIAELMRSCLAQGCRTVLCFCTNFRGGDACGEVSTDGHSAILLDSLDLTLHAACLRIGS